MKISNSSVANLTDDKDLIRWDSKLLLGTLVSLSKFTETNKELILQGLL